MNLWLIFFFLNRCVNTTNTTERREDRQMTFLKNLGFSVLLIAGAAIAAAPILLIITASINSGKSELFAFVLCIIYIITLVAALMTLLP